MSFLGENNKNIIIINILPSHPVFLLFPMNKGNLNILKLFPF